MFALPDGETGPRTAWVSYEREGLARTNPGVRWVTPSPSRPRRPRHAYETPIFAVKEGVTELHWDTWPRIDDAIASYAEFARLRDEGVIPSNVRFQVGLPFPSSALNAFKDDFGRDYPIAERGFEELVGLADAVGGAALGAEIRALLADHPPPVTAEGADVVRVLRATYAAQERAVVAIAAALDSPCHTR